MKKEISGKYSIRKKKKHQESQRKLLREQATEIVDSVGKRMFGRFYTKATTDPPSSSSGKSSLFGFSRKVLKQEDSVSGQSDDGLLSILFRKRGGKDPKATDKDKDKNKDKDK